MTKKRVLITGGGGFIGTSTCSVFLQHGFHVRVLDLSLDALEKVSQMFPAVEAIQGDVRDGATVHSATRSMNFVIHLAGKASVPLSFENPKETLETNLLGTLNVLEAAHQQGIQRTLIASSCSVYGQSSAKVPLTEKSKLNPLSPYALSKIQAEELGQFYLVHKGVPNTQFRIFNVYGPHQNADSAYSGVIAKFIQAYASGVSPVVFGTGRQSRDFIFVLDTAQAFLKAVATPKPLPLVLNLGSGNTSTLLNVLSILESIFKTKMRPTFKPARQGDIVFSSADTRLCRHSLSFKAETSLEAGLKKTVD